MKGVVLSILVIYLIVFLIIMYLKQIKNAWKTYKEYVKKTILQYNKRCDKILKDIESEKQNKLNQINKAKRKL